MTQSSPDTVDLADLLLTLSDVEQSFGRDYNAKIMREAEAALRAQAATSQARIAALEAALRVARKRLEYYGAISDRRHFDHDLAEVYPQIDAALAPEQDK